MTRGTITPMDLSTSGGTIAAAHTIVSASGAYIAAGGKSRTLFLQVKNSGTVQAGTVTVKAGDNPPAWRQGLGDLSVVVPVSSERLILFESARFMQDDGTINIDFSTSLNSEVCYAYRLPADI